MSSLNFHPFFYQPDISHEIVTLCPEESEHITKVLRLKKGNIVNLTDGKGKKCIAMLDHISYKSCTVRVKDCEIIARKDSNLQIVMSPTKSIQRMEWFVEKSVELGVGSIAFLYSHHSERKTIHNYERLHKKAIAAMKQSKQVWLPPIIPMISFEEIIDKQNDNEQYIAHSLASNFLGDIAQKHRACSILVGPEGGFSSGEIDRAHQKGWRSINLGSYTLRSETAGIAACCLINMINLSQ